MFGFKKRIFNELSIDELKKRTNVLFIDDEKRDDLINYLENEGWHCEQLFENDFTAIDNVKINHAQIVCVDVNGVGKKLGKDNQGLDVVVSIKNRFPEKKIILYSSEKKHDSFHLAFQDADKIIPKTSGDNEVFCTSIIELSKEIFNWDNIVFQTFQNVKEFLPASYTYETYNKRLQKAAKNKTLDLDLIIKVLDITEKGAKILLPILVQFLSGGTLK